MNNRNKQESLTLEILETIDSQSDVTQRNIAKRMNIALGLANSYLKRCVRKGWVKIHQAPANRYLYYLTPTGFTEKSRLTAQYLSFSFTFYRKAGNSCNEVLHLCAAKGWSRLVLCGVSDLAEIAALRALEHNNVEIVGVYDRNASLQQFLDKTVFQKLEDCEPFDVCLVTELTDAQSTFQHLTDLVGSERVIAPSILGLKLD